MKKQYRVYYKKGSLASHHYDDDPYEWNDQRDFERVEVREVGEWQPYEKPIATIDELVDKIQQQIKDNRTKSRTHIHCNHPPFCYRCREDAVLKVVLHILNERRIY